MSLLYMWFSAIGYIVTVFHLELFLCLHVRLICALNYYLLTYLLTYINVKIRAVERLIFLIALIARLIILIAR